MKTYKFIMGYVRDGELNYDCWYQTIEDGKDAIIEVVEKWHEVNDPLFLEAKDAELFIKVD